VRVRSESALKKLRGVFTLQRGEISSESRVGKLLGSFEKLEEARDVFDIWSRRRARVCMHVFTHRERSASKCIMRQT
jgi:hypothetical protein